jgi:hypothetical protein
LEQNWHEIHRERVLANLHPDLGHALEAGYLDQVVFVRAGLELSYERIHRELAAEAL